MGERNDKSPAPGRLAGLTRAELMFRLQQLDAELTTLRRDRAGRGVDLLHELQVHQVELEMQNRELQEAQAALEDSRGRYAELYHNAPTGYLTLDRASRVVEANATVCALFGHRRTRVLGGLFDSFLAPESRPAFHRCLEDCFLQASEQHAEVMLQPRRGASFAVQVNARRAQGHWGPGEHVHISVLNVSDRYRLDEQLKFSLAVGDALFGTLEPDVVAQRVARLALPYLGKVATFYLRDRPQKVDVAVHGTARVRQREGLVALTRMLQPSALLRLVVGEHRPLVVELSEQTGAARVLDEATCAAADALGLRTLMVLPALSRGEVLGVLLVAQHHEAPHRHHAAAFCDDFARRIGQSLDNAQLYQRRRGESQARRNLLAVVSHDLRNPLSVVMLKGEQMVSGLAAAEMPPRAQLQRGASVVLRCAHRMNELIGDLLDATSMEIGSFSVATQAQSLGDIVTEAVEAVQASLAAKRIVLVVELEQALEVRCDRRRTLQVLNNILGNAAKFTERNGRITLRVQGAGHFALVTVADTGPGMDAACSARIFDRFWQNHETAHLGSGLGLSICKGIVEASGGRIWVDSVLGMGSTFSFTLPRTSPELPASHPPQATANEVVFVGEADGLLDRDLSALLLQAGVHVVRASDAAQALDYLARHPLPRGLVLELCAPQAHGWDFLAARESSQRLSGLAVLTVGHDPGAAEHVRGPKTDYLVREELGEHLQGHLRRVLEQSEATDARAQANAPLTH